MNVEFSENLRLLIKKNKMTYAEFGKRIDVSAGQIGLWVRNENMPNTKCLIKICKEYDVTPNWLLGFNDDANLEKLDEVQEKLDKATCATQKRIESIIDGITSICDTIIYMKKQIDK